MGLIDAAYELAAPLRWCLFVEPVNVYRGTRVRLEAVLANEDVLRPGKYPKSSWFRAVRLAGRGCRVC